MRRRFPSRPGRSAVGPARRRRGPPEVARADGVPAVLIPDEIGWVGSQPAPAEVLLSWWRSARKYGRRPAERGRARRKPFRDDGGEAIQQQIGWTKRARRRRSQFGGTGYVGQAAGGGEATGEERGSPGVEVGLAGKLGVEPLKPLSCVQQQWRRCVSHARC